MAHFVPEDRYAVQRRRNGDKNTLSPPMRGLARPDMDASPERVIRSLDNRKAEHCHRNVRMGHFSLGGMFVSG
jgi:hypothetical protein